MEFVGEVCALLRGGENRQRRGSRRKYAGGGRGGRRGGGRGEGYKKGEKKGRIKDVVGGMAVQKKKKSRRIRKRKKRRIRKCIKNKLGNTEVLA